ncbi:563_t:CDS:2 [Ambispora leptoticha]|uniref:563_t:CDS:1 n=1 Tax=Ambispora leptoticha TaxID=144679 RepID=A0A9N8YPI9_9GLOM|nr:563_t:CDS:2 [Ambispora leptoticha]
MSSSIDNSLRQIGGIPLFSMLPEAGLSLAQGSNTNNGNNTTTTTSTTRIINNLQNNEIPQAVNENKPAPVSIVFQPQPYESNRDINPISILNTLQHKLKSNTPPRYDFTMATPNGGFYATLEVFGRTFQTQVIRVKKQEAKEEVAALAVEHMNALVPGLVEEVRKELDKAAKANAKRSQSNLNRTVRRKWKGFNKDDGIPKSLIWLNKHREPGQPLKRPSVLLLEFCQFHHIDRPVYTHETDASNRFMFSVKIGERNFRPTLAFWNKNDAKDHVAQIAFDHIYREQLEIETKNIGNDSLQSQEVLYQPLPIRQNEGVPIQYPSFSVGANTSGPPSPNPENVETTQVNDSSHSNDEKSSGHEILFHPTVIANQLGPPPKSEIMEKLTSNQTNLPYQPNSGYMQIMTTLPPQPANNFFNPYTHFHHPYINPTAYSVVPMNPPPVQTDYKRYVSRLYELAQSKKWEPPVYSYTNVYGGFIGEVVICDKSFRGTKACARKADAKEDVSEHAWKYYADNPHAS